MYVMNIFIWNDFPCYIFSKYTNILYEIFYILKNYKF